jgi:hypothetical protein
LGVVLDVLDVLGGYVHFWNLLDGRDLAHVFVGESWRVDHIRLILPVFLMFDVRFIRHR